MSEKTNFGTLLKHYRQAAGLTQEALATRAGLSTRAISDLERGINRAPRSATLELLVNALPLTAQQQGQLQVAAWSEGLVVPNLSDHTHMVGFSLPPTRLIGREVERSQALTVLRNRESRLLTLTGPSGVGKTRFSIELAKDLATEFRDGVVFAPLAPIRDAAIVPSIIAEKLGVRESTSTTPSEQVKTYLREKDILLVLDNVEQVSECAGFVSELVESCPRLILLATSRAPLRLRAEKELLLAPLLLEDAVDLFIERAQAGQQDRSYPRKEVAAICEQVDCLPLAIELAARHVKVVSLPNLRKRLANRLSLLREGAGDLPPRQQTMEEAITWSYELLPENQQRCLRALGVFVGSWTLEAAEAVCWEKGDISSEDAFLTLEGLVNASLVQTDAGQDGAVRFHLLELIREFALKRLAAAGETEACRRRHALYYANLAETVEALFGSEPAPPDLPEALESLNIQAAMQWSEERQEAEPGLRLAGFARLWQVQGKPSLAKQWLERMLALDLKVREAGAKVAPLRLRIMRLYGLGRTLLGSGQMAHAETVTAEALRLSETSGDEHGLSNAWATLGLIAQANGKLIQAEHAFNKSELHAGRAGDPVLRNRALVQLAELARGQGDFDLASQRLKEALATAKRYQMRWDTVLITTLLGHLAHQQQDDQLAEALYQDSLKGLRPFKSPTYTAWCLEGFAAVRCAQGNLELAARLCAASAGLRESADSPIPPVERLAFEQIVAAARTRLGEQRFWLAWTSGAELSLEQAIEIALEPVPTS